MMSVACKDMGQSCDFVARGSSREEVEEVLMEHGMNVHDMTEADMTSAENMDKLDSAMQSE